MRLLKLESEGDWLEGGSGFAYFISQPGGCQTLFSIQPAELIHGSEEIGAKTNSIFEESGF